MTTIEQLKQCAEDAFRGHHTSAGLICREAADELEALQADKIRLDWMQANAGLFSIGETTKETPPILAVYGTARHQRRNLEGSY